MTIKEEFTQFVVKASETLGADVNHERFQTIPGVEFYIASGMTLVKIDDFPEKGMVVEISWYSHSGEVSVTQRNVRHEMISEERVIEAIQRIYRQLDNFGGLLEEPYTGEGEDSWFTFGQDHVHMIGKKRFDKDVVAKIHAPNANEARAKMMKFFGNKWAFQYDEEPDMKKYYPGGIIEL
jgi:hypothetical protein